MWWFLLLLSHLLFCPSLAVPTPTRKAELADRDLLGGLVGDVVTGVEDILAPTATSDLIGDLLSNINSAVNPTATSNIFNNILNDLQLATATEIPIAVSAASSALFDIYGASPTPTHITDVFDGVAQVIEAGLTLNNLNDIENFIDGVLDGENSFYNINFKEPAFPVYPRADVHDAPYDLTEAQLRGAIYIPPTFQYGAPGAPQPVILVPGTGSTGYLTFIGNYIPLLTGSDIADPVWLNIPGYQYNDAQTNAEYVAYAINYIYGVSNWRQVAVASWSQGGIDAQWAYKYWPSTRYKVTDQISFSPDYHGTVFANYIATPDLPLPPSVLQQEYDSQFITTLRAYGGDAAYVPTTTIYSGFFDEIVEPQQGVNASAYLLDDCNLGVTNNEVQTVCKNQLGGSFYTHEGILYNPLGFALFKDALAHPGPGQPSRLNLEQVCSTFLTEGLDLTDFLLTENTIPIAAFELLVYPDKTTVEPPIKQYAQNPPLLQCPAAATGSYPPPTSSPTWTTSSRPSATSNPWGSNSWGSQGW